MWDLFWVVLMMAVTAYCFFRPEDQRLNIRKKLKDATSRMFKKIPDNYHSLAEVEEALREQGLEASKLIVAIDYTKSNLSTGRRTFYGRSLHSINPRSKQFERIPEGEIVSMSGAARITSDNASAYPTMNPELAASMYPASAPGEERPEDEDVILNPYQQVIRIMGQTLKAFDEDGKVYCVGFGDKQSTDRTVLPFHRNKKACDGFEEVIRCYNELTPKIELSGPTDFTAVIEETIRLVDRSHKYTILLIITDGEISNKERTGRAIVKASNYPISIVCIGVGDGPFDTMDEYDDELPKRRFDNFQFVSFEQKVNNAFVENPAAAFAMHALMEIPEQYAAIKKLGLLGK